jgi:hypothetical protein
VEFGLSIRIEKKRKKRKDEIREKDKSIIQD